MRKKSREGVCVCVWGGGYKDLSVGAAGLPQRDNRDGAFVVGEEAPGLQGPAASRSPTVGPSPHPPNPPSRGPITVPPSSP